MSRTHSGRKGQRRQCGHVEKERVCLDGKVQSNRQISATGKDCDDMGKKEAVVSVFKRALPWCSRQQNERGCNHRHWSIDFRGTPRR